MAPYSSKDSFILFPFGTSGVESVISLKLWDTGQNVFPSVNGVHPCAHFPERKTEAPWEKTLPDK